jgi:hypothetical protein
MPDFKSIDAVEYPKMAEAKPIRLTEQVKAAG